MYTYVKKPDSAIYGCDPAAFEDVIICASDNDPGVHIPACNFDKIMGVFVAGGCTLAARDAAMCVMGEMGYKRGDLSSTEMFMLLHEFTFYPNPYKPVGLKVGDRFSAVWGRYGMVTVKVERITRHGVIYASRWNHRRNRWTSPRRLYEYKNCYGTEDRPWD